MRKLVVPCLVLAAAAALAIAASATGAPSASAVPTAIPGCGVDSLTLVADGALTIGADNPAFPPWFGGAEKTKPWKVSDPFRRWIKASIPAMLARTPWDVVQACLKDQDYTFPAGALRQVM